MTQRSLGKAAVVVGRNGGIGRSMHGLIGNPADLWTIDARVLVMSGNAGTLLGTPLPARQ